MANETWRILATRRDTAMAMFVPVPTEDLFAGGNPLESGDGAVDNTVTTLRQADCG